MPQPAQITKRPKPRPGTDFDLILEDHGWLERLHGPRATGELAIELATRVDGLLVLEEPSPQFADRLDPDLLQAIGCPDFPYPPLHVVGGSRR
jgi:hypothetical protein